MNPIDLCTYETIEIACWSGNRKVPAHRYQEFGVHRLDGNLFEPWRISHLPSGQLVAVGFENVDAAVAAMIEIAKLRNDWAVIEKEDLNFDLKDKCDAIMRKHGGKVTGGNSPYKIALNGYGELAG